MTIFSSKAIYLGSKDLKKKTGVDYPKENIVITPGSKEAMLLLHVAFNGEIILSAPSWVSYEPQAKLIGHPVIRIDTTYEDKWHITPKSLQETLSNRQDPKKPAIMIFNSPGNPDGCSYSDEELQGIAEVCRKFNVLVIADEIYNILSFNGKPNSLSKFYPEATIVTSGLSKWCGAGGWRLGYFIIPDELNDIKNMINVLASETFSAVSAPIQYAAIKAYENDHSNYISKSVNILSAVGKYVFSNLKSNKVLINEPQGGFYLMPEFLNNKFKTSSDMCSDILNNTGVALLPGSDFGFNPDKMLARLSFTDFDGQEFMNNIEETKKIDESLINKFAPKVVEGVNKLKNWSESL